MDKQEAEDSQLNKKSQFFAKFLNLNQLSNLEPKKKRAHPQEEGSWNSMEHDEIPPAQETRGCAPGKGNNQIFQEPLDIESDLKLILRDLKQ